MTVVSRYAAAVSLYAIAGLQSVASVPRYAAIVPASAMPVSRHGRHGFESLTVVSPYASLGNESGHNEIKRAIHVSLVSRPR
ncbi:MAG: hypothetical protein ACREDS_14985 [Limisphaerales bacterium]